MAKVSVRVAHQRGCANETRTATDSVGRGSGCTCKPSYYTLYRDKLGRATKGQAGSRPEGGGAVRDRAAGAVDAKRLGLHRTEEVTFSEWVDRWRAGLERAGGDERKESTKRDSAGWPSTARRCSARSNLSELTGTDVERFLHALTDVGPGAGEDADADDAGEAPALSARLPPGGGPQVHHRQPGRPASEGEEAEAPPEKWDYFTDDELEPAVALVRERARTPPACTCAGRRARPGCASAN